MKKAEAEVAIRSLCHKWGEEVDIERSPNSEPSFIAFISWVNSSGYGRYLDFRSARSARADAELWFDEEFQQAWRN